MRVLIVPDKFKGTLAAPEVCAAIASGWKSRRPQDDLELLPMSDGGDGFGEAMGRLFKARLCSVKTVNAAHQPIGAQWWWVPGQKLAIIEAARVIGLAMLPAKRFHPFQLDTFGLGRVLEAAARSGARHCLIGIGGSATNDAGFGLARALGWKFPGEISPKDSHIEPLNPRAWIRRDAGSVSPSPRFAESAEQNGERAGVRCLFHHHQVHAETGDEVVEWWQLHKLAHVIPPRKRMELSITVAVDVTNPLLGARGCSRVYGPQKGLRPEDMDLAEECLHRLKTVLECELDIMKAKIPGAGAAGGLGFGLMAFAGAQPRSGFECFAEAAGLEERIRKADLVITGEGAIDRQSFMGKGVGEVVRLCGKLNRPCIGLAGVVNVLPKNAKMFSSMFALTDFVTLDQAKARAAHYLAKLGALAARGDVDDQNRLMSQGMFMHIERFKKL